jgi:hypothetical protein
MKTWEQINNDLGGQNGIVYIMYIGRNTTGERIWREIDQSRIVENIKETGKLVEKEIAPSLLANEEQVYAAQRFLLKNKYIRDVKKEGHYRIRTASIEALVESQQQLSGYATTKLAEIAAKYIDVFPKYVNYFLTFHHSSIRGKEWSYIYEFIYDGYIRDLCYIAVFLPRLKKEFPNMNDEKIIEHNAKRLKQYHQLSKTGAKQIKMLIKTLEERTKNINSEDSRVIKKETVEGVIKSLRDEGFSEVVPEIRKMFKVF